MNIARMILMGTAAASLVMTGAVAQAKGKPAAARKLALSGMQGAGVTCIRRPGHDGDWVRDAAGAWLRQCTAAEAAQGGSAGGGAGGGAGGAGGGLSLPLIGAGLAAAVGIAVGVSSGSDSNPSSP